MNRIAGVLPAARTREIAEVIRQDIVPLMTPDVSSYADGRRRIWLGPEPRLGAPRGSSRSTGFYNNRRPNRHNRLEAYCERIWRTYLPDEAPLAATLITSGERGIDPHRDASYARPAAITINLGGAVWQHNPDRDSQDRGALHETELTGGEILVFDCKHLHACRPAPDRLAIHLWSTNFR